MSEDRDIVGRKVTGLTVYDCPSTCALEQLLARGKNFAPQDKSTLTGEMLQNVQCA